MSLSGLLDDVSVADLLQFVHLGGRSGTLVLETPEGTTEIGFYRGHVVSARVPGAERLGDMLLAAGTIDRAALDAALRQQAVESPRRALGQVLLAMGALSTDELYRALAEHVARAVQAAVGWRSGAFRFCADDLRLLDGLAVPPADILSRLDLNTQMLLLEGLRLFDEKNRPPPSAAQLVPAPAAQGTGPLTPVPPAPVTAEVVPAPAPRRPRLQVISGDAGLIGGLRARLGEHVGAVVRVTLREAGAPAPGEPPPLVLVDLRGERPGADALTELRRARPRAPLLAVVRDEPAALARAYEAGAAAAVPADLDAAAACVRRHATLADANLPGDAVESGLRAGYARLRRVLDELRHGLVSASMALQLMSILSESVERAVFLLVRPGGLVALGAFGLGAGAPPRPLAEATRGLVLPRRGAGLLEQCLGDGRPRSGRFADAALPPALVEVLGTPRTGQAVAFPVIGRQRPIAVIYTDNGGRNRLIDEIDVLELATAQVGLAFESELLLRRARHAAAARGGR